MKYEKFIDENEFLKFKNEAMEASRHVLAGIEALKTEGIPTDEKTVKMLTASPDALENYIRDAANNQIGTGFMPPEEKSRIYEVYSKLLARINGKVQAMRGLLSTVPLVFKGEEAEIDVAKIEKIAKDRATHRIDMEGLNEYYSKVKAVEKALNEMRAYEVEKGLPNFYNNGLAFTSELGSVLIPKLENFLSSDTTFERFKRIAKSYFIKK